MNIIIESGNIAKAAKDARLSLGDAVQVCIKKRKDNTAGQLITCDGNSQTHVLFKCEMDVNEAKFIAGPEFLDTVSKMAEMGEVIEIVRNPLDGGNGYEDCIRVSCGGSSVLLRLKEEMKLFQMKQDASTVSVKMSVSKFKDAICYGGYCASKDDNRGLKNVIELQFHFGDAENEKQCLCVQTTDFYKGAKIEAGGISSFQMVNGKPQRASGEMTYALDCARIQAMAGILQQEGEIDILLNKGQAVFSNAGRIFMFRAFEKRYPDLLGTFEKKKSAVWAEANAVDIKRAAELISVVGDTDRRPIILSHEKGMLLLSDEKRTSVSRIPAKIEGKFEEIGIRKENLILGLVKASSEKVCISICGTKSPFFITGNRHEGIYFAAPVLLGKNGKETDGKSKNME